MSVFALQSRRIRQIQEAKHINRVRVRPNLFYIAVDKDKADKIKRQITEVLEKEGVRGLQKLNLKMSHNQANVNAWVAMFNWVTYEYLQFFTVNSGSQNDYINFVNNGSVVATVKLTNGSIYTDPSGQYADIAFVFIDDSSSSYTATEAQLYLSVAFISYNDLVQWSPSYNLANASNLNISKSSNQTLIFVWTFTFQLASGLVSSNPQLFFIFILMLFGLNSTILNNIWAKSTASNTYCQSPTNVCGAYNETSCMSNWTWYAGIYQGNPAIALTGIISGVSNLSTICIYISQLYASNISNQSCYSFGSGYLCIPISPTSVPASIIITLLWVFEFV